MAKQHVKRRLAVILAADVVGYSRLMREGETRTSAQLKTLRKETLESKTREHRGRNASGDGVLIEFARVEDAVQHTLDVQRALVRMNGCLARKVLMRTWRWRQSQANPSPICSCMKIADTSDVIKNTEWKIIL